MVVCLLPNPPTENITQHVVSNKAIPFFPQHLPAAAARCCSSINVQILQLGESMYRLFAPLDA
jgi:hypothetical protein